jgi:stage II sporulation protein D
MAAAYIPRFRTALAGIVIAAVAAWAAPCALADSTFFIRGGGDGHGIGMSQYGAYGYALHGRDYRWILAHYYRGTTIGRVDPNRIVRVLLSTGSASFSGASKAGPKSLKPGTTYTVSPNADGSVTIKNPAGKKVLTAGAPLTVTGAAPLSLAGVGSYRGSLEFRPDGAGGIQSVEAVGLDDYVRGVISAEMPAGWSAQALQVQAVAARTYAITTDVAGQSYDLYPDTRSQMYRGVAAETASTDAAVAATRGEVVTYDDQPVVTYFFNSSGGHTENIENVWPGATPEPWLKGVPDPYDGVAGDPYHRWGSDLTLPDAAAKLGPYVKGDLIGIRVTKHGSSPRILTAQVVGTKGTTTVTGIQMQHAFGLLTTYAAFSTVTTLPGRTAQAAARAAARTLSRSAALTGIVPLLRRLAADSVVGLHGTVFPAGKRTTIAIQRSQNGRWRTVGHTDTTSSGSYDTGLPGRGTYRIVYSGLNGPAISVS